MSKPLGKNEPTGYPEYAVRAEVIGRYFSPPLASSTFHDFVNKGKIVPLKGIRGFYKLNDSLRRLGLREVAELPETVSSRTAEEIIRLAFCSIDPEVFHPTSSFLGVDVIDSTDFLHAELIFAQHSRHVVVLDNDRLKHGYLQGVLDAAVMQEAERRSTSG